MRQLADDGMEPWQIAAAMNVRESAVLVALGSHTPAGGAVRAVERASSVVPAGPSAPVEIHNPDPGMAYMPTPSAPVGKPDRTASRGSGAMALRDRLRALGVTAEQVRDWAATRGVQCPANGPVPGRVVDAWEAEHAAPLADLDEHDDCFGCVNAPVSADPAPAGQQETPEETDVEPDLIAEMDERYLRQQIEESDAEIAAYEASDDAVLFLDALAVANSCTAVELEHAFVDRTTPTPPALRHVHDPYVAWTEAGIPYAVCDCGQTWERQTCEACPAIVAALHVATHGPIHKHCAEKKNATERTNP
jgi:hypothetical protein